MVPRRLQITRDIYEQIKRTVGMSPAEQGGILGGDRNDFVVRSFHLDDTANQTGVSYSPNHKKLNQLLDKRWNPAGINLLGFVHSHPPSVRRPSSGDLIYAQRILDTIPQLPYLLSPIVVSKADTGVFELYPYAAMCEGNTVRIVELALDIVGTEQPERADPSPMLVAILTAMALMAWVISKLFDPSRMKSGKTSKRSSSRPT